VLSRLVILFYALMLMQSAVITQSLAEEQYENLVQIRIGHFVADMGAVDLYIDDVKAVIDSMAFGTVSAWYQLPEGDYQLSIVPAGQGIADAVLVDEITLIGDGWYSVFVGGLLGADDLFLDVVEEDYKRLEFGQTRLSFYNGFAESMTMVVDSDGNRLAFLDNHNRPIVRYASLVMLAGDRQIQFLEGLNNNRVLFDLGDLSYGQQRHYLIALVGGTTNPRIVIVSTHLLTLADDIQGDLRTVDDENASLTGFIRVVHLSSGTPPIDAYLNEQATELEAVEFSEITDFIEVEIGAHTVQIVTGDDASDALIETDIVLRGGQYLTIAIYGFIEGDTFGVIAFEEDLSPIERGLFRLTVFQAIPTGASLAVLRDDGLDVISFLTYPGFLGGSSSAKAELVTGAYGFSVVDLSNSLETLVEIPIISYGEGRNYLLAFIPIDVGYVIESIELPQNQ
jgi:hypothetical protein